MRRYYRIAAAVVCAWVSVWSMTAVWAGAGDAETMRYRIAYATYLGGSKWDQAREVIPLPDGSVYVGAQTSSTDIPVTPGAAQPKYAGDDPALGHGGIHGGDCYVAHLSADGRRLLAATYFGGSKQERNVYGMALDRRGNVVICSMTRSPDVPVTAGCFQSRYGGGRSDWFVAKLSPDLKRTLWCTYVGGSGDDSPRGGLGMDSGDHVYVVGGTDSPNFPTTEGVLRRKRNGPRDAAIVKLKPDGSGLVFSTLLGGGNRDGLMGIRVDPAGSLYVAGHTQSADFPVTEGAPQTRLGGKSDCFMAKLSSDGGRLLYSTYLGGRENEFAEHRPFLAANGSVLLAGSAGSPDFPTTDRAFQRQTKAKGDGFLTKISPDGKRFVFSTLLGGSQNDFCLMPTPDSHGNIVVVGQTSSRDLPVTADALQLKFGGGAGDGALAVFSPDGSRLVYATYLGGNGDEMIRSVAVGPNDELYLVGNTASKDFPVTTGAFQPTPAGHHDAYVVKLVLSTNAGR